MAPVDTLPTELILRILSYLPLQSLRSVRLLDRRWNEFFGANESTIYHHAALLHNFVDSLDTLLPEARQARCLNFLQDVPDWYQYCRKYFQLQKNWAGKGTATLKVYGCQPYDIHRIKVDEKHGLVITTHEYGGLTVFDMETSQVLWRLPSSYVRRFAHCEYENGFLIFDRLGVTKEVWRLETLYDPAEGHAQLGPDELQMDAWQSSSVQWSASAPRGHFRPWSLIQCPEFGRAYRFVYPDLLVSGLRKAYIWDIRTGQRTLEVDNIQGSTGNISPNDINYVELSATHVFICSSSALRVFSRQSRSMVLEIPSYRLSYSQCRLAVKLNRSLARQTVASPGDIIPLEAEPSYSTALYGASYAEFSAVHVSRSGTDLVAQLSDSRVVLIRDFMRVARGEVSLMKAVLEVGKTLPPQQVDEHFSIYLTYEFGRVGLITTSGVYVLTPDPTQHGLLDPDVAARENVYRIPRDLLAAGLSFPHLTISALPFYHDRRQLTKVSCAQMTETKLFFVWDAMYKPDSIDFFRRMGMIEHEAAGATRATGVALAMPPQGAAAAVGADADAVGDAGDHEPVAGPSTAAAPEGPPTVANWVPLDDDDSDEEEWEDAEEGSAGSVDDQDVLQEVLVAEGGPLPGQGVCLCASCRLSWVMGADGVDGVQTTLWRRGLSCSAWTSARCENSLPSVCGSCVS
ncbi:hypothetical protein C8Q78DRAFT_985901 [Trametes maxima]|nr:hypothetical protein C8Q78DRAFT_985901 [Trametes maxima]